MLSQDSHKSMMTMTRNGQMIGSSRLPPGKSLAIRVRNPSVCGVL